MLPVRHTHRVLPLTVLAIIQWAGASKRRMARNVHMTYQHNRNCSYALTRRVEGGPAAPESAVANGLTAHGQQACEPKQESSHAEDMHSKKPTYHGNGRGN